MLDGLNTVSLYKLEKENIIKKIKGRENILPALGCIFQCVYWKKSAYKWNCTTQTGVILGSSVYDNLEGGEYSLVGKT